MAHLYRRVRFAFETLAADWLRRCGWYAAYPRPQDARVTTLNVEGGRATFVQGKITTFGPFAGAGVDNAERPRQDRAHVRTTQRVAPFETCSPPEQTGVVGPSMFVPHDAPSVVIGRVDLPPDAGR